MIEKKTEKPTVLVIYHATDMVQYRTFEALAARGEFRVVVAAPAEANIAEMTSLPSVEIAPIKSKFSLKAIRSIRQAIRETGAGIVFASSTSALSNTILASGRKSPKIVGYRGTQARVHRFDPTYRMALLNPRVDHIVCETTDIHQYLEQYIRPERLSGMPKPYMRAWVKDSIANPEEVWADDNNSLKLSYVGVSEGRPHKGLSVLLKAIAELRRQGVDDVRLTVVGKASEADMAAAPEGVKFMGNRPDAVRYIAGSQVFVLPSLRDASPRVVREAQACGMPCIVADIAGARDLIMPDGPDQSGLLVTPGDAVALAEAIVKLKKDPQLRQKMGLNGLKNIDENYSLEAYTDYFAALFKNLEKL